VSRIRDVAGALAVAIRTRSLIVTRGLTEGQGESGRAWHRIEELVHELLVRLDMADPLLTPLESWGDARKAQGVLADGVVRQLLVAIESYGLPVDPRAAHTAPAAQLELGGVKKVDTPADAVLPAGDRAGNPPP